MKKETRTEREKRRYDAVMRALYHDPRQSEKARQARGWSDMRIKETYGIDAAKRLGYSKAPSRQTIRKSKIRFETFKRLRQSTVDVETAAKAAREKVRKPAVKAPKITRSLQWERWSKKSTFPKSIKDKAVAINRKYAKDPEYRMAGFEDDSDYGWAVMYWAYVQDRDPSEIEKEYLPDRFDSDRYMDLALQAAPVMI